MGSAAVSLAAAKEGIFPEYLLGDKLEPLVELWRRIITEPSRVASEYGDLWLREQANPINEYYIIRSEFNTDRSPAKLLYLLARCVKNAVRFNPAGEFNQSPDKRRKGTRPPVMTGELMDAHRLFKTKAQVVASDFLELCNAAQPGDFFYLDPPYQGTSDGQDSRYISGLTRERLIAGLRTLNDRNVPFVLSYDGALGTKTYGDPLPAECGLRTLLDVGRSSQATLNGHNHVTIEALYISNLIVPTQLQAQITSLHDYSDQRTFTFA